MGLGRDASAAEDIGRSSAINMRIGEIEPLTAFGRRRDPRNVRRLFWLPWRTGTSTAADVNEELPFHIEMPATELIVLNAS